MKLDIKRKQQTINKEQKEESVDNSKELENQVAELQRQNVALAQQLVKVTSDLKNMARSSNEMNEIIKKFNIFIGEIGEKFEELANTTGVNSSESLNINYEKIALIASKYDKIK